MKEKTTSLQAVAQGVLDRISLTSAFSNEVAPSPFAQPHGLAALQASGAIPPIGNDIIGLSGNGGPFQLGVNPATLERISLGGSWEADNNFEL
jgi:hypothetical protein